MKPYTSEQYLHQIIQSVQEGVVVVDADLKCRVWNLHMQQLTGKPQDDIIGCCLEEVFPFLKETDVIEQLSLTLDGQSPPPSEFPFSYREMGKSGWMRVTYSPFKSEHGLIIGVVLIVRDITETKITENLIRESKAHLEQAQTIAKVGSWQLNPNTGTGTWSHEMFHLLYCDETKGRPEFNEFLMHVHPEDRKKLRECHDSLLQKHIPFEIEYRTNPDFGPVHILLSKSKLQQNEQKELMTFSGTTQDITGIKHIEEEIVSLSRFPTENPNPVFRLDRDGKILFQNRASESLLEQCQFDHPDRMVNLVREALSRQSVIRTECELDGRTYSLAIAPIKNSDYVNVYGLDITELKKTEDNLRKREISLKAAQQLANMGNWEMNIKTGTGWWSEGMYRISQRDPASGPLTFAGFKAMVHPEDKETFDSNFHKTLTNRTSIRQEYRLILPDNTERWIFCAMEPLLDSAGEVVSIFGIRQDITDRKLMEERTRKNEAQLAAASQIAQIGYWEFNVDEGVFTFNDQFYSIYKTTAEQAGGYKLTPEQYAEQFLYPEDRHIIDQEMKNALETEDLTYSRQIEHRIRRGNDEEGYVAVRFFVVKDKSGRTIKTYGANQDITARKRNEIALQESRAKLIEAQRLAGIGDFTWYIDSGKVIWSDGMFDLLGYDKSESINIDNVNTQIHHPDDLERVTKWLSDSITSSTTKLVPNEYRLIRKDGAVITVHTEGNIEYQNGKPVVIFGMVQDITDRKLAETQQAAIQQELINRNHFIETILEYLPIGLGVNDIDSGEVTYLNRKFEEIYGWPKSDIPNVADFFNKVYPDPIKREVLKERIMGDISSGDTERMAWEDLEITTKTNEKKIVSAKNIPISDQNLMISTVQDVTARKQIEKEKQYFQTQLAQAQKMESIGRLAGGVAHDFNNMLGVILGNIEFALQQVSPDLPVHADLEEIHKAAKRSADLTRQLLAFARKQTVTPILLNLNDTVSSMYAMLQRIIGEDIDLVWIPGGGLWQIKMDPGQIDQILANLCVNAKDAIAENGKVTIETSNVIADDKFCSNTIGMEQGEYVMLAVSDNGCGMSKEVSKYIFEPFFTTKNVGEGTGLGLATVYGIVKQNRGFVYVDSEPEAGATFRIYFPRYAETGEKETSVESDDVNMIGQETVLLVEDEKSILNIAKRMLESLGYRVLAAATPGEAIRIAEEHAGKIDLLVTDVVMPEMDGHELAKKLLSLYPELGRLFISGYTANVIAHRGVLEEGVHFLQKPFLIEDLGKKVREALGKNK
ncbi:MAG: PAS domain S-box protein [Gammaproteobacteria bacterium]|nr:PAS domain S-box protein [Gammaproteobacteria bacterium]